MRSTLVTVLTLVVVFDALAWIFGVLPTLKYALNQRVLPTVGPIRLLAGPMEALGIEAVIVTGLVFVVVSALKLLAAYWLWQSRLDGAVFELILLGLSAIFWYAFDLPFGPIAGIAQIILIVLVWGGLS